MMEPGKRGDRELDELFAAYRDACVAPEAGADFMPRLWERIDSRKKWIDPLWRWANSLAAVAAAASLMFVLMQVLPAKTSLAATSSYVELLAEEHESEDLGLQLVSWAPVSRTADGAGK